MWAQDGVPLESGHRKWRPYRVRVRVRACVCVCGVCVCVCVSLRWLPYCGLCPVPCFLCDLLCSLGSFEGVGGGGLATPLSAPGPFSFDVFLYSRLQSVLVVLSVGTRMCTLTPPPPRIPGPVPRSTSRVSKAEIMSMIKADSHISCAPTEGVSTDSFTYDGVMIILREFGGHERFRGVWPAYYNEVHGLTFVVDASDEASITNAREVLWWVLGVCVCGHCGTVFCCALVLFGAVFEGTGLFFFVIFVQYRCSRQHGNRLRMPTTDECGPLMAHGTGHTGCIHKGGPLCSMCG